MVCFYNFIFFSASAGHVDINDISTYSGANVSVGLFAIQAVDSVSHLFAGRGSSHHAPGLSNVCVFFFLIFMPFDLISLSSILF
jgi:hypothetical protein